MYIAVANKVEAKAGAPSPRISLPHVWLTGPTRLNSPEIFSEFSFQLFAKTVIWHERSYLTEPGRVFQDARCGAESRCNKQ